MSPGSGRWAKKTFTGQSGKPFNYDGKIEKQMQKRGLSPKSIDSTLNNPHKVVKTRDVRFNPETRKRNDSPATAYFNKDGSYIVRNNETSNIVQVSNRSDVDGWKAKFYKSSE